MPRSMHLQAEIHPNLKSIPEYYSKFLYISITQQSSLVQPDIRMSPPSGGR